MVRHYEFSFRVNHEERQLIAILAERLQSSQSDTIRLLILEAVRELIAAESEPLQDRKGVNHANDDQHTY
jgi:hypothetical protein